MEEMNLINTVAGSAVIEPLCAEDTLTLQIKLWHMLSRLTGKYTMGDSTSVPVETAGELMTSLCFTLGKYLRENKQPPKLLVTSELDKVFKLGQKIIEIKIETGKQLWKAACLSAPDVDNISFRDTLRSIEVFFKRYDYRFLAHQIPCEIDYQLCHPVPGDELGIEYINEYLHRIIVENSFLHHFDCQRVRRLLESYCPDYQGLLINLCEPVIVNAVGLTLIGSEPRALDISDNDRACLAELFEPLSEEQLKNALIEAAVRLAHTLGIKNMTEREYLAKTAEELCPRITVALPDGHLHGIFLSLVK